MNSSDSIARIAVADDSAVIRNLLEEILGRAEGTACPEPALHAAKGDGAEAPGAPAVIAERHRPEVQNPWTTWNLTCTVEGSTM